MKGFLTIDDFDFEGKRVLLRVDLNSVVVNGKVKISDRIIEHAKTIKELIEKKARVVVLAHQGRPGDKDFISLKQHAKLLNKYVKIKFVDDIIGDKAIIAIKNLKNGEALLLDNVRFLKEELDYKKGNKFVERLKPLFDIFVSDAFSVTHRKQTSVVGFAEVLPNCLGRTLEKEINAVQNMELSKKPCVYVIGGEKPDDYMSLITYALRNDKVDRILACGLFGQLCLIAKGYNLGGQNKYLEKKGLLGVVSEIRKLLRYNKIETPVDMAVNYKGERKDLDLNEFPVKEEIFDIGAKTAKKYGEIIKGAKTILMKGTCGYAQDKRFSQGTRAVLKAIERSDAFSLIGGGHSSTAVKELRINKSRISYISLSGGALIGYLSGEKLPGLEVLRVV